MKEKPVVVKTNKSMGTVAKKKMDHGRRQDPWWRIETMEEE